MRKTLIVVAFLVALNLFLALVNWISTTPAADFISIIIISLFVIGGIGIIVRDLKNAR